MVLSIGMIVKNEEKYLERCLTALKPILENVDSELIIADTGSNDRSVEIAKKFTDNVFHFEWINDFAAARNSTLERAKGEWYMFLDADEIFQDCSNIIHFFNSKEYKDYGSATFVVRSYADTQDPEIYTDFRAYRLTIKRNDVKFIYPIHEGLSPPIKPCKNLDLIADHYGYLYYDKGVLNELAKEKSERNIQMLTRELEEQEASGHARGAIYNQIADCYDVMGMFEKSLEYVNKGLENVNPNGIAAIMYYTHKFSLLLGFKNYEEAIELSEKYFSKENPARKKPLSSDCYVYAVRGISYSRLEDYSSAISNLILCFDLYNKYCDGKLVTEDLLMGAFRVTLPFMKSCYELFYKCCIFGHSYDAVNAANKLFPLSECLCDHQYMLMHLSLRVEIMDHTNYNKLGELYRKLDNYNRAQLIRIMRWRFFKTDKHDMIVKKLGEIVNGDRHLEDTIEIFRSYYVKKNLNPEQIEKYIVKYSALENEDIWCIMLLAGYDITPYITNRQFNSERCTRGVYINYMDNQDAADLFANYNIDSISAEGLEQAASVYGWAIIGAQQNKLDISKLFEKFGQIGLRWRNEFPEEDTIPGDIKAAFFVYNITAARLEKDYQTYIDLTRKFVAACPMFAPIMKYYQEAIEEDMSSSAPDTEFAQLAAQVKQNIRNMIAAGNISDAEKTLAELEQLCPDDPDIEALRTEINSPPAGESVSEEFTEPEPEFDSRKESVAMKEVVLINSDNAQIPNFDDDMLTVRHKFADVHEAVKDEKYEATIVVWAYNRLDKTKECIESILKYTKNINFNLILIDNGSTDGTFEYFKSLDYDKTHIVRITKNIGGTAIFGFIDPKWISKYLVLVTNDLIVTEHWLDNMLAAVRADKRIGMINPMSTNSSNLQQPDIAFTDIEDFQKKAAAFNQPDPAKWQERLRLITLGTLFTKECLLAVGLPLDCGFIHDFGDDEITFRVRHAGYKAVLAGDVVIHHNHDFRNLEGKDPVKYQRSLEMGRKSFRTKFFGVDAWDDVNNYVFPFIRNAISKPADKNNVKILGIDTRCGTPILDIKNIIREFGVFEPEISAFTQDAKYYTDLKTVCGGSVVCDRIEYLRDSFKTGDFDYVIIEKSINEYNDAQNVVKSAYSLLKKNGQMFFPIKNIFGVNTLMNMLGYDVPGVREAALISPDEFVQSMREVGINNIQLFVTENIAADQNTVNSIRNIIDAANPKSPAKNEILSRLIAGRYWFKIVK